MVDPGVGTSRRACAARLKDEKHLITPDNGTLTHLLYQVGIEAVREIDETVNRLKGTEAISVFHGRDLFAYTAARLASEIIDFTGVGPEYPVSEIVLLDEALVKAHVENGLVSGIISNIRDPFGSVTFNITIADFVRGGFRHGDMVCVTIRHGGRTVFEDEVLFHKSFGYVPIGEPILFHSSAGYLSIGLNQGSFLARYSCRAGRECTVKLRIEMGNRDIPAKRSRLPHFRHYSDVNNLFASMPKLAPESMQMLIIPNPLYHSYFYKGP